MGIQFINAVFNGKVIVHGLRQWLEADLLTSRNDRWQQAVDLGSYEYACHIVTWFLNELQQTVGSLQRHVLAVVYDEDLLAGCFNGSLGELILNGVDVFDLQQSL